MAYSTPKCEFDGCEGTLEYEISRDVSDIHTITKNGKISKKKRQVFDTFHVRERLKCDTCFTLFEIDYGDKNRIVRGDLLR